MCDDGGWIDASKLKPTEKDADIQGCVLAWHRYDGARITGWRQFSFSSMLTHWQHMPRPPVKYREVWEKK